MNQPLHSLKIKAGDCFLAPLDGIPLYYQQQANVVIHIDVSKNLICLLEREYILTMYQQQRPVARILQSEFTNVAGEVLNQLGCRYIEGNAFWDLQESSE